ncbi:hypothetical protein OCA8868_01596 [Octadecabacter ascidiaceicola]|uniref:Uncharacterized protein n=1 Tax=Octadecabacter ascidiaceicola TaxID=1655543 RepID=A0A238K7E4_9RHOB|nr:hypothetical protein OCA8868_01596 [Octadecabacter ascidiaceicola]
MPLKRRNDEPGRRELVVLFVGQLVGGRLTVSRFKCGDVREEEDIAAS